MTILLQILPISLDHSNAMVKLQFQEHCNSNMLKVVLEATAVIFQSNFVKLKQAALNTILENDRRKF